MCYAGSGFHLKAEALGLSRRFSVMEDMSDFIRQYEQAPADLKSLKIHGITNQQIIDRLKKIYCQFPDPPLQQ